MTGPSSNPRPHVDQLTDDMLDQLYADLDRCDEVQGEMNENAINLARALARTEACLLYTSPSPRD